MKKLFPLNKNNHGMIKRYKSSAVISIQKMLNEEEKQNDKIYKQIVSNVLRTCDSFVEPISSWKFTKKEIKINKIKPNWASP